VLGVIAIVSRDHREHITLLLQRRLNTIQFSGTDSEAWASSEGGLGALAIVRMTLRDVSSDLLHLVCFLGERSVIGGSLRKWCGWTSHTAKRVAGPLSRDLSRALMSAYSIQAMCQSLYPSLHAFTPFRYRFLRLWKMGGYCEPSDSRGLQKWLNFDCWNELAKISGRCNDKTKYKAIIGVVKPHRVRKPWNLSCNWSNSSFLSVISETVKNSGGREFKPRGTRGITCTWATSLASWKRGSA
jgi:hypothetical protein